MGREVKIGFVTPLTGGLASFGVPDKYCVERADGSHRRRRRLRRRQEAPGHHHHQGQPVRLQPRRPGDRRPHQQRQGRHRHRGLHAGHGRPGGRPGEANGTPCITNDCPWQPYIGSRSAGRPRPRSSSGPTTPSGAWKTCRPTSSTCGARCRTTRSSAPCSPTTPTATPGCRAGNRSGSRPASRPIVPSQFQDRHRGLHRQITAVQEGRAARSAWACSSRRTSPTSGSRPSSRAGSPRSATYAKALLFPQSVEALGDIANGLTTEVWWTPTHPFTSSLLGETCQQFADEFTAANDNGQWTQPLLHFIVFEMAVDALQAGHQRGRQRSHPRGRQDHQARDHRRPDRLHRAGRVGATRRSRSARATSSRTSTRPRSSVVSGARARSIRSS